MDSQLNNSLLTLFKAFIAFCDEHHLTYYAAYGTALGAVRHKGMIPWDDDIDVWMPRKDYDKLLSLRSSLKGTNYEITDVKDKGYYLYFAKFCDRNSTIIEREGEALLGLYLDIFPLDNYDSHKGKFLKRINWIYRILWLVYGRSYRTYSSIEVCAHLKKGEVSFLPKLLFYNILKPFRGVAKMGIKSIQGILLSIPETNKIWTYDVKSSLSVIFSKDWFGDGIKLPFEDLEITVPSNYDKVLKTYYGDYMTPPPATQRQSQHYRYFIDLEKRYSRKEIMEKMYGKRKKN